MTATDDMMVQNVDPVQAASGDMPLSVIDDIERRANATAMTLQAESSSGTDGANEGKVAGELAIEAAGGGVLKMVSMVTDVLTDRVDAGATSLSNPTAGKTDGIVSGKAMTMDQMILKSLGGERLVMGANIASQSLREQEKESVGTWAVNSAKVEGVGMAKRLTFDKVYANQHALDSVPAARAQYASTMHSALQMSPGMAPRPNAPPSEMRAQAASHREDMDRWRDRTDGNWTSTDGTA